MHQKCGKDSLVVISVNLDDPTDKDRQKEVLDFLKAKKATFINLAPDEKQTIKTWAKELKIDGIPVTDVYDSDGKRVKRFEGLDPEELDKLVGNLLKK